MFYTSKIPNYLPFTQEGGINCDIFGKHLRMEKYKLKDVLLRKKCSLSGIAQITSPQFRKLVQLFPNVESQDLKVNFGLHHPDHAQKKALFSQEDGLENSCYFFEKLQHL